MRARRRHWLQTLSALALIASVISMTGMPPAHGAKPTRTVIEPEPLFIPAGFACEFAISGEPDERARQAFTEFSDGRVMTIGHAAPTFTNLETDGSITHRSRYRALDVYDPVSNDLQIEVAGRFFVTFFPGDVSPDGVTGPPGAFVSFAGHIEATLDLDTNLLTAFAFEGRSTDLCELLRVA